MSMHKTFSLNIAVAIISANTLLTTALADEKSDQMLYGFGVTPTGTELAYFLSVKPDGSGLPAGQGSVVKGQSIYQMQCAACHGVDLKGLPGGMSVPIEMAVMATDTLIGGRGSLTTSAPMFTVESHWPYATTLWDYIKRTMPLMAPGSLTDDEVYSLVAYILARANIIPEDKIMNDQTLPQVVMPNREGFVNDPRPEFIIDK